MSGTLSPSAALQSRKVWGSAGQQVQAGNQENGSEQDQRPPVSSSKTSLQNQEADAQTLTVWGGQGWTSCREDHMRASHLPPSLWSLRAAESLESFFPIPGPLPFLSGSPAPTELLGSPFLRPVDFWPPAMCVPASSLGLSSELARGSLPSS